MVFGTGVITDQIENYITVKFNTNTVRFVYPDAFDKFIQVEDAGINASIVNSIEEAKATAERQRQVEEAARKAFDEKQRSNISATPQKVKKPKSIDEMFDEDYHVEKLMRQPILTYQQVEEQFGIKISGFGRGINSTDTTIVLISSIGRSGGKFVYHDRWTANGDYIYSG